MSGWRWRIGRVGLVNSPHPADIATAVTWQISSGPDLVTVPATVVVVNGQFFHVARVAFETRFAGSTNVGRTPNVPGPFFYRVKITE